MDKNKEIEKILLEDATYKELVSAKIEQEFIQDINLKDSGKKSLIITDIKKVPKDKLFSKQAVFLVMNKMSKTKSYINGVQAEGYLGSQVSIREKLLNGEIDSFVSNNSFVKFDKVKI